MSPFVLVVIVLAAGTGVDHIDMPSAAACYAAKAAAEAGSSNAAKVKAFCIERREAAS